MALCSVHTLLASLTLCLVAITKAPGEQCVSCSYTRSSVPTLGYECITTPQNFTNVACNFTRGYVCYSKADYNDKEYSQIRWFNRGCNYASALGTTGCPPYGDFPSCLATCNNTNRCNDQFGDLHAGGKTVQNSTATVGNAANSVLSSSGLAVVCFLLANLMSSRRP